MTTPEVVVERVYAPEDLAREGDAATADYRIKGEVRFTGLLRKQGDQRYRLTGTVRGQLELDCGRCLEAFDLPVVADVDLSYVPQPSGSGAPTPADVELQDEDLSTAYYHEQVIDLGEMVREQFNLALPMRPLCTEDCKGLCPQCGTNRNHNACTCDVKWEDPRLAGLRSLLTDKEHRA